MDIHMEQYYTAPAPSRRGAGDIRASARELLYTPGCRMRLVTAQILVILFAIPVKTVIDALRSLMPPSLLEFDNEYGVSQMLCIAVILLFAAPLLLGIKRLSYRQCRGEESYASDVFGAYRNLPRTWLVMLICLIPAVAGYAAVCVFVCFYNTVYQTALVENSVLWSVLIFLAMLTAGAVIMLGGVTLALRWYFFPSYAMRGDMSVGRALSASWRATRGRMREITAFLLGFSGWAALSVLSLGVLHILHTAPYYQTAYTLFADSAKKV